MQPRIQALFSICIDDLDSYSPPDPVDFNVSIRLIAGPDDQEGEESFDFNVCSPAHLAVLAQGGTPFLLRHIILADRFDFPAIRAFVERYVRSCSGENWLEVGEKLSRLGHWEFEDYKPGGTS